MRDDRGEVGITHLVQRVAVQRVAVGQAVRLHFDVVATMVVATMKDPGPKRESEPGLALPFSCLFR